MTIPLGSVDSATCPHPPNLLIIVHSGSDAAGAWTATCRPCATTFRRGQPGTPQHVIDAVAIHVGAMVHASAAEAATARAEGRVLQVGQPWSNRTNWEEGCQWDFFPDPPYVRFAMMTDIDPATISDFHHARTEFALIPGDHALILCIRWYGRVLDWRDGAWQASRAAEHGLPTTLGEGDVPKGGHAGVHLSLVNRTTGIIAGMRMVTWPARFFNAVRKAVQTQIGHGMDDEAGAREIDRWYELYPTARDLARRAEITCKGGGN